MTKTRYTALVRCEECERLQAGCVEESSRHVSTGKSGCPDCGATNFDEVSAEELGL